MYDTQKRFFAVMITLLAAIGSAGIAMGETQTGSQTNDTSGPLGCEIQTNTSNGRLTLETLIYADNPTSGSYRFSLKNSGHSGSSSINQGGNFSVAANGTTRLGRVMLSSKGTIYEARLEVTANGVTVECAKRIGGNI